MPDSSPLHRQVFVAEGGTGNGSKREKSKSSSYEVSLSMLKAEFEGGSEYRM